MKTPKLNEKVSFNIKEFEKGERIIVWLEKSSSKIPLPIFVNLAVWFNM